MSNPTEELLELFIRDLERLEAELIQISSEDLWKTKPGIVNSVGILAQHIVGNLNHFIGTALGKTKYIRDRDKEFTETGVSVNILVADLKQTREMIAKVLSSLDEDILSGPYPLDIPMDYSVNKFLYHLYGHLNYHLGQVYYLRRIVSKNQG